jgi:hypothetical protein
MAKAVIEARPPDGAAGPDAIYRRLFGSFNPDQDGWISPLEVLNLPHRQVDGGAQPGHQAVDGERG